MSECGESNASSGPLRSDLIDRHNDRPASCRHGAGRSSRLVRSRGPLRVGAARRQRRHMRQAAFAYGQVTDRSANPPGRRGDLRPPRSTCKSLIRSRETVPSEILGPPSRFTACDPGNGSRLSRWLCEGNRHLRHTVANRPYHPLPYGLMSTLRADVKKARSQDWNALPKVPIRSASSCDGLLLAKQIRLARDAVLPLSHRAWGPRPARDVRERTLW